jgi:hypothetical protein
MHGWAHVASTIKAVLRLARRSTDVLLVPKRDNMFNIPARCEQQSRSSEICRETNHGRSVSSSTQFQDDECVHYMKQKTFWFCASCIKNVRTRACAVVETSFASRNPSTWLFRRLLFTDVIEIIYRDMTWASSRMLVLALLVLFLSFGALLWPRRIGSGVHHNAKTL